MGALGGVDSLDRFAADRRFIAARNTNETCWVSRDGASAPNRIVGVWHSKRGSGIGNQVLGQDRIIDALRSLGVIKLVDHKVCACQQHSR
jgi:hypothetical protein